MTEDPGVRLRTARCEPGCHRSLGGPALPADTRSVWRPWTAASALRSPRFRSSAAPAISPGSFAPKPATSSNGKEGGHACNTRR
ncbi:hypothetical protein GFS60_00109 [Rhodococcus sp. WAY2]|nr:hypothetical protein GFS60_00109 [Rhodococcus sp. WAY2]